jgi:hypothetical protein
VGRQRCATEFCVRLEKSGSETLQLIHQANGDDAIRRAAVTAIYGFFQQRKGISKARNFEVINGLQQVFEKWVERCKKCIACQGS